LATGSQHIVTHAEASPTTPLVAIGDDIFWVRMSNVRSPAPQGPVVDELNVSSGAITPVARGRTIFCIYSDPLRSWDVVSDLSA
jgi:hypothetical protein